MVIVALALAIIVGLSFPLYTSYASSNDSTTTFNVALSMDGRSGIGLIEADGEFTMVLEGSKDGWNIYKVTDGYLTIITEDGEISLNIANGTIAAHRYNHKVKARLILNSDASNGGLVFHGLWIQGDAEGEFYGYFVFVFKVDDFRGVGSGEAIAIRV